MKPRDVGSTIKLVGAFSPVDSAAATVTGTSIDRAVTGGPLYLSGSLLGKVGAASGTPDSFTAIYKIQDSPDDSTWADVSGATFTLDADAEEAQYDINFGPLDRYVRAVVTLAFVAGTTPKIELMGAWALGGADREPI